MNDTIALDITCACGENSNIKKLEFGKGSVWVTVEKCKACNALSYDEGYQDRDIKGASSD